MAERLVVIGGDAAGMTAASVARRGELDLEVVVLERGAFTSYAACGIPFHVAGEVEELSDLVVRTPEESRAKHDIDVRLGHEATAIDLDRREVEARDRSTGDTVRVGFDRLMLGMGAGPIVPDWPGVDQRHVSTARDLHDAGALAALAADARGRPVAVVGGGYIGVEMAEAFARQGARVTLLDRAPQLLPNIDADMAALLADAVEEVGVDLRLGAEVIAIEGDRLLTEAGPVPAAIVVHGLGIRPRAALAADAGIATGVAGAVVVDDHQRTSVEGVYAAGDCAETVQRVTDSPAWIALGTVANKQGRVAGTNLGGGDAAFPGSLGTAITRFWETEVARTGLTEREATEAGLEPRTTSVTSTTTASYLPGAEEVATKLVYEASSSRLLGGQVVGGAGAGKRIDTIAAALWADMTIDDLVYLDLAYAPPFGPVWDPINMAARRAR